MNIFFTCSTSALLENYKRYNRFIKAIKEAGHKISDEWVDEAKYNISIGNLGDTDAFYQRKLEAIYNSDLLIAEGTIKSFTVGHQITIALTRSIPVLFFYQENKKTAKSSYVEGIKSIWLTKASYRNDNEAIQLMLDFIKTYSNKNKKYRFNLVLTQAENAFLESQMKKLNISKTEIIRSLIKKEMNVDNEGNIS